MSKKLNREIKCIDHLQGHNKRQGSAHYTDRDIRVVCTERSQPVKPLAIFCGCTVRFVSDLVVNPEDRFSHDMSVVRDNQQIILLIFPLKHKFKVLI